MSLTEIRLDLGIDYGCIGGPAFNTTIVVCGDDSEQRNVNWVQPLGRWQIGQGRGLLKAELDYLIAFHAARLGSDDAFRFKDWTDYKVLNGGIATGNGTATTYQLVKRYTQGGQTVLRPITKLVSGTVKIYLNGVLQSSGFSVNLNTGLLTFSSAPGSGVVITADFEFDVPVRFEQDKINFRFEVADLTGEYLFYLEGTSVVEQRVPPGQALVLDAVPQSLTHTLDVGYDYGTTGGPSFDTQIQSIQSGYERRDANISTAQKTWNLGQRGLTQAELDYFIALFRVCRGRAVSFQYYDYQQLATFDVRFDQDQLAIRFDHVDGLYYLPGLQMVQIMEETGVDNSPSFTGSDYSGCIFNPPPPVLANTGFAGWSGYIHASPINGMWLSNDSESSWITYTASDTGGISYPTDYDYSLTYSFSYSYAIPVLNFRYLADERVLSVLFNGVSQPFTPNGGLSTWIAGAFVNPPIAGDGNNVITFNCQNEGNGGGLGNPTGFRLEWL